MTEKSFDNILIENRGGVAILTINRPKALNALNAETLDEIDNALRAIKGSEEVKAIVITGGGEKAFVAGADIRELSDASPLKLEEMSRRGQRLFRKIEHFPKPVIAAINGFALGGGCELALACHFRTASENAKLGLPEVSLGIIPGYGGTQRLPRIVGKGVALEMMLSGDPISAQDALRVGLVNHIYQSGNLLEETLKLAAKIASRAPIAVSYCIEVVNRGLENGLDAGLLLESKLFGLTGCTEDLREGMKAFLEKRPAQFKNK